jgi:NADPH:quinone reductase-like Zn-dependent oxidoreductase
MRVAGIDVIGAPLELFEVAEPRQLADDEVLIEVMATGVGHWDDFARTGAWDVGRRPPMALGVEAAGTVLAVGSAAGEWAPGDAVMTHPLPLRDQGTWAPRLIAPAGLLASKPPGVSWAAAAAFPVPALTARQVLVDALGLQAGEQLLINGASGVTGGLLVALAVLNGAQVIATADPAVHQRLLGLGADHVIDYHDSDWPARVRALTGGRGVTVAANAAPRGAPTATALQAIADDGRFATITGAPPASERGITIASVYVRPDGTQLRQLAAQFGAGQLQVPVKADYHLAEAAHALAVAIGGHTWGAVILTP